MEKDKSLFIAEEQDVQQKAQTMEDSGSELKQAMKMRKLKEAFFKESEINKDTEFVNDDYENEIDKSILEMEHIGQVYDSDDDHIHKHRKISSTDEGSLSDIENNGGNSSNLVGSTVQRQVFDPQITTVMLPFYERRRLSECIEESESDEETAGKWLTASIPTSLHDTPEVTGTKKRFTVTKAYEEPIDIKVEVKSILKKTPSPPSNQKSLTNGSPKKIRYEAGALKDFSAQHNSQTIHFPCQTGLTGRSNVKSLFSPQGILYPHLDRSYFDTSLVEIRASQTLATSTKSLDDKSSNQLDNNVWVKRVNEQNVDSDKIGSSCESISASGSVSCAN